MLKHLAFACLALALHAATAAPAKRAVPVVVATVGERPVVEEVPVSGTITAARVARLSPAVAGLVEQVNVDAGDRVEAGRVLLQLDPALARWELSAARAATLQAREELADAQRRLNDLARLQKDRAIAATQVRALESEVRIDAATIKLREAEQRTAAERLDRHALRAPFAGVIGSKQAEAGEWVSPGDAVLELIADKTLRVEFRVPQAYFPRVDANSRVLMRIEALGGDPLLARIGEVVPVSDPSARTFLVRAYPEGELMPLTPGMSASGTLRLQSGRNGVVVPRDALLRYADGRITAWVVEPSGNATRVNEVQVEIGLAFDGLVAIRDGLRPGMQVVVEGNEALQPGQAVSIHSHRQD